MSINIWYLALTEVNLLRETYQAKTAILHVEFAIFQIIIFSFLIYRLIFFLNFFFFLCVELGCFARNLLFFGLVHEELSGFSFIKKLFKTWWLAGSVSSSACNAVAFGSCGWSGSSVEERFWNPLSFQVNFVCSVVKRVLWRFFTAGAVLLSAQRSPPALGRAPTSKQMVEALTASGSHWKRSCVGISCTCRQRLFFDRSGSVIGKKESPRQIHNLKFSREFIAYESWAKGRLQQKLLSHCSAVPSAALVAWLPVLGWVEWGWGPLSTLAKQSEPPKWEMRWRRYSAVMSRLWKEEMKEKQCCHSWAVTAAVWWDAEHPLCCIFAGTRCAFLEQLGAAPGYSATWCCGGSLGCALQWLYSKCSPATCLISLNSFLRLKLSYFLPFREDWENVWRHLCLRLNGLKLPLVLTVFSWHRAQLPNSARYAVLLHF